MQADFEAILHEEEDADFAYKLFDGDGDGFVVESEVHDRFEEIYRCLCPLSARHHWSHALWQAVLSCACM